MILWYGRSTNDVIQVFLRFCHPLEALFVMLCEQVKKYLEFLRDIHIITHLSAEKFRNSLLGPIFANFWTARASEVEVVALIVRGWEVLPVGNCLLF